MNKPPNILIPPGEIIETRIFADNAQPLQVIPYSRLHRLMPDGSLVEVKQADNIVLSNGMVWNPALAARQNEPLLLAVCYFCRFPRVGWGLRREAPTTGLTTLNDARACAGCHFTGCERHCPKRGNGQPLCDRCARRKGLWQLLKPLFFRQIDD